MFNSSFGSFNISQRGHTPQENEVLHLIDKFGCITTDQLSYFVAPHKTSYENYSEVICNHLKGSRQIKMIDNVALRIDMNEVNEEMISSLWCIINIFKDRENISDALKTTLSSDYPCSVSAFRDNHYQYKVMPILRSSEDVKIRLINDEVDNETEEDDGLTVEYLLLTDDVDMLVNQLTEVPPKFPCKVVSVEGDIYKTPEVAFYEIN